MEPANSKPSLKTRTFSLNKNRKKAMSLVIVAIFVAASVFVIVSFNNKGDNMGASEEKELPELTWKKFLEYYDTDGDGFVDDYAPEEFKVGESIVIKDVAQNAEYDTNRGYSIITCNSTINSPLRDIPLIAYKDMQSSKGKLFTYTMTFLRYSHYSSLTGTRIETISKELSEIIEPNIAVDFSPTKTSPSTWRVEVISADRPINAKIMKYMITDENGSIVCTSGFPEILGTEDVNGVVWNDVNDDGNLDQKDTILIHNEKIGSSYKFTFEIVYGARGMAMLP